MSPLPEKVLSHLKEVVSHPMEPKAKLLYFALVIDSGGETMPDIPEQKYQDITGLHDPQDFMVTLCIFLFTLGFPTLLLSISK